MEETIKEHKDLTEIKKEVTEVEKVYKEPKKQDMRLYEPDWDNITTINQFKVLFKSIRLLMNFDITDPKDKEEVDTLTDLKIIKEVKASLQETNKQ